MTSMAEIKPIHIIGQGAWDNRFLDLAAFIASWSKDPSTKCGAVITCGNSILSVGYNGFPKGIEDDDRLKDRKKKYPRIVHAEVNALIHAGKLPFMSMGTVAFGTVATLYTWPFQPCADCTKHLIQAGIHRVVAPICTDDEISERWKTSTNIAADMFREAGVTLLLKTETEEQEMKRGFIGA